MLTKATSKGESGEQVLYGNMKRSEDNNKPLLTAAKLDGLTR